jgi:hypothetical protein
MTYEEIRALYERLDSKYHPAYVDPAQMETLRQIRYSIERIAAEAAERGDFRWSLRLSTLDSLLRMSEDFDKERRYDLAILSMVVAHPAHDLRAMDRLQAGRWCVGSLSPLRHHRRYRVCRI